MIFLIIVFTEPRLYPKEVGNCTILTLLAIIYAMSLPEGPKFPFTPVRVAEIQIRDEFIDAWGHVTYLGFNILWERQRDAYMQTRGIGLFVILSEYKLQLNIPEDHAVRNEQLTVGDVVDFYTMAEVDGPRMNFHQSIDHRNGKVSTYKITTVLVDATTRKLSRRIPGEIAERLYLPENEVPFISEGQEFYNWNALASNPRG